jgi:acetyl/propionyl-CoA carboxylase alpha subunit
MEMNTRLQVEHPVTELITGLDLVDLQLRVAAGEPLPLSQADVQLNGHAIEARLYAENPDAGFLPQTGTLLRWSAPANVRVDAGVDSGTEITSHYDPLLAKIIAHGATRDDAWAAADEPILQAPRPTEEDWQLAAALFAGRPGWRSDSVASFALTLACGDENRTLEVGAGSTAIEWNLDAHGSLHYTQHGITRHAIMHRDGDTLHLARDAAVFVFREASPLPAAESRDDPAIARASVAGTVTRLEVGAGDTVIAGQTLAVIEAMKMEMRVTASAAGTVTAIRVLAGRQVVAGAILMELDIEDAPCLPMTKPS